jgi:hypothetical protein
LRPILTDFAPSAHAPFTTANPLYGLVSAETLTIALVASFLVGCVVYLVIHCLVLKRPFPFRKRDF